MDTFLNKTAGDETATTAVNSRHKKFCNQWKNRDDVGKWAMIKVHCINNPMIRPLALMSSKGAIKGTPKVLGKNNNKEWKEMLKRSNTKTKGEQKAKDAKAKAKIAEGFDASNCAQVSKYQAKRLAENNRQRDGQKRRTARKAIARRARIDKVPSIAKLGGFDGLITRIWSGQFATRITRRGNIMYEDDTPLEHGDDIQNCVSLSNFEREVMKDPTASIYIWESGADNLDREPWSSVTKKVSGLSYELRSNFERPAQGHNYSGGSQTTKTILQDEGFQVILLMKIG